MSRRAVTRDGGAGTAVLVVVTAIVAALAIGAAVVGAWFVLTH